MIIDGTIVGWIGAGSAVVLAAMGGTAGLAASVLDAEPGPRQHLMARASQVALWVLAGLFALMVAIAYGHLPTWLYWVAIAGWFAALGPAVVWIDRRYKALGGEARA